MHFEKTIAAFLDWLALSRGRQPSTVSTYGRDLRAFGQLAETEGWPTDLAALEDHHVRGYVALVASRNDVRTLRRKLAALRAFFAFAVNTQRITDDPTLRITLPRTPRRLPKRLSVEQAAQLMEPAQCDESPFRGARNQLILELLYGSGLRISELIQLDAQQLAAETGWVRVLGKGAKERDVPLTPAARRAWAAYVPLRRSLLATLGCVHEEAAFVGQRGRRLTARRVQAIVKRLGQQALGHAEVHPHLLRHACATHMLEGGADLRVIQSLLGHAKPTTTQIYTHLSADHLRQAHARSDSRRARLLATALDEPETTPSSD